MKKLLAIVTIILAFSLCTNAQDTESFNSYNEMVASAKAEVEEISVTDFHKMYIKALSVGGPDFTLIDVRTEAEYSEGFIPGAFLVQ